MTEKEIADYVASGDSMDKAGAYGIQGLAAIFISEIKGDYYNVVGLPISRVYHEIEQFWFAAGKETLAGNKRTYICDFSRCGLNTRLYTLVSKPCSEATNIGSFISCELSLAAEVKSEFMF